MVERAALWYGTLQTGEIRMKKTLATIAAAIGLAASLMAEDEEFDGRTWTFTTNDVEAVITGVSDKSGDWSEPVTLERAGNVWTLPADESANFFRAVLEQ